MWGGCGKCWKCHPLSPKLTSIFWARPPAPVLILSNGAKTRKSFKPSCVSDSGNIKTGVRGR